MEQSIRQFDLAVIDIMRRDPYPGCFFLMTSPKHPRDGVIRRVDLDFKGGIILMCDNKKSAYYRESETLSRDEWFSAGRVVGLIRKY